MPGEVSLAAALIDGKAPHLFLTQKAEREMPTGAKGETASPAELIRRIHGRRVKPTGRMEAGSGSPGAVSRVWRLRTRSGRVVAVAVVWNGETASLPALEAAADPLLRLMRER